MICALYICGGVNKRLMSHYSTVKCKGLLIIQIVKTLAFLLEKLHFVCID